MIVKKLELVNCLNPYFNGIYFLICVSSEVVETETVLILILMEYTF